MSLRIIAIVVYLNPNGGWLRFFNSKLLLYSIKQRVEMLKKQKETKL